MELLKYDMKKYYIYTAIIVFLIDLKFYKRKRKVVEFEILYYFAL